MSSLLVSLLGCMVRVHVAEVTVQGRLFHHQGSRCEPNHRPETLIVANGENLAILRGWEKIQILSRLEK